MSWMSLLLCRFFGKSSFDTHVEAVVAQVEPTIWQLIEGRVPMGAYEEVRGYVWARSAEVVRAAVADIADENVLSDFEQESVARHARHLLASRIVTQLRIYAQEQLAVSHAA